MLQQTYTPSNTGIESFIRASADYDLAPVGIGSMQEQAGRLAEFGRNGDIYVVHAAEGETVIPTEVLDANPQVREMLFAQMRDMGLNPDEYVVGSELNSINPDTGMPEFFFKKLFRGVKKIVKAAAPLIVPLLGNMILPGIGGLLASAVYTKATGGSWGDVLKGVAMSYLGGAVMGGFTAPTGTSFAEGFMDSLSAPYHALKDLSGSLDAGILGSGGYSSAYPMPPSGGAAGAATGASGAVTTTPLGPPVAGGAADFAAAGAAGAAGAPVPGGEFLDADWTGGQPFAGQGTVQFDPVQFDPVGSAPPSAGHHLGQRHLDRAATNLGPGTQVAQTSGAPVAGAAPQAAAIPPADQSWRLASFGDEDTLLGGYPKDTGASINWSDKAEKAGDWLIRGGDTQEAVDAAKQVAQDSYIESRMIGGKYVGTEAGIQAARAEAGPNIYQRYGPTLALLGGAAVAGGALKKPERDPGMSDEEWAKKKKEWATNKLFAENQADYVIPEDALDPYKYRPPANQYVNRGGLMELQPRHMTNGGAAQYPRREMLVEGPGTERSDDIPAMLSDGEFVLNSRSVRGADPTGQGDRRRGAQNLYNMMRNFEMRA